MAETAPPRRLQDQRKSGRCGAAAWASKFVSTLLYGLQPRDPSTLIAAVGVLAAIGVAAGWLPARRASRIDPARVLRDG